MSRIERRWLEDGCIDGSKVDPTANFNLSSINAQVISSVDGTFSGNILVSGDSTFGAVSIGSMVDMTTTGNICVGGRLGIGTTNPQEKMHVVGNLALDGTDVRVFNRSASSLLLGTNNSEKIRITSDGRVGIGTTNPSYALSVFGVSPILHLKSSGNNAIIFLDGVSNVPGESISEIDFSNNGDDVVKIRAHRGTSSGTSDLQFLTTQAGSGFITTRMIIKQDGKVGVGTTSPAVLMDVAGDIGINSDSGYCIGDLGSATGSWKTHLLGSSFSTARKESDAWVEKFVIQSDGSVGMGTTAPRSKLDIVSSTSSGIYIRNTGDNDSVLRFQCDRSASYSPIATITGYWGTVGWPGWEPSTEVCRIRFETGDSTTLKDNGQITFGTKSSVGSRVEQRLVLTSIGTLGLGTTNPAYNFHLYESSGGCYEAITAETEAQLIFRTLAGSNAGSVKYSFTDNYLALFTNGTERIRINSNGDVGIGTTNPGSTLTIWKSSISSSGYPLIHVRNTSATKGNGSSSFNYAGLIIQSGNGLVYGGLSTSYDNIYEGLLFGTQTAHPIYLVSSGNTVGIITSTGLVGFGTTNPGTSRLKVVGNFTTVGNANITGNCQIEGSEIVLFGSSYIARMRTDDDPTDLRFQTYFEDQLTIRGQSAYTGYVGIGTTDPRHRLDVNGDIRSLYLYTTGSGGVGIGITSLGTMWSGSSGTIPINLRVQGNSYVSGNTQLGNLTFDSRSSDYTRIVTYSNLSDLHFNMTGYDDLTIKGGIETPNKGYVGIGSTNPQYNLDVSGNLRVTGNGYKPGGGSWASVSDIRLKKNIEEFNKYGLSELKKLRPVSYQFNGLGGTIEDDIRYVGYIAQEVIDIIPEMVTSRRGKIGDEETDILNMDTSVLPFVMIEAIKELSKKNEELEQRLLVLEK